MEENGQFVSVFKYITQHMCFSVLLNWVKPSPGFDWSSLKFIVLALSSVAVGGGSEPSGS